MRKISRKGLKRVAAAASAVVIAGAMAAPLAWAADIPGAEGLNSFSDDVSAGVTGSVNTNIHLLVLDEDNANVISVTAPAEVYLAAKAPAEGGIVDFQAPTPGVAKIQNLGSSKVKVDSWAVDAGAGTKKVATDDAAGDGFYMSGTTEFIDANKSATTVDDTYWLKMKVGDDSADIAAPSDADKNPVPASWKMQARNNGSVGDHLDLAFEGQIYNPTKAYYASNPVIDRVTWTFGLQS